MPLPARPLQTIVHGARAAEAHVLAHLDAWSQPEHDARETGPWQALQTPIRVVVPSASLRRHLSAVLVRPPRTARLGIQVQTHHALALELLQRAGQRTDTIDTVLPILIQRLARQHEVLHTHLDALDEGYGAVVTSVRDLIDAGLESAHAEAVAELLVSKDVHARGGDRRRARALIDVTSALLATFELTPALDHGAQLLRRATALLDEDGAAALPTRALVVHGFADATGVVSDFVERLLGTFAGELVLDQPPDPASPTAFETAFPARFALRMRQTTPPSEATTPPPPVATVTRHRAFDPQAEVRHVAHTIRYQVKAGLAPEAIGVVARDLGPFTAPLRAVFTAFGLPFSGVGATGPWNPRCRPLVGLLDLVRRGRMLPVEQWIDLLAPAWTAAPPTPDVDPMFEGPPPDEWGEPGSLDEPTDRRGESIVRGAESATGDALRRHLFGRGISLLGDLEALADTTSWPGVDAGRRLLHLLDDEPTPDTATTVATHAAWLRRLAHEALGWSASPADAAGGDHGLDDLLVGLETTTPTQWTLDRDEMVQLLDSALHKRARVPLGGRGGGVQVLNATEARGRTFEQLFVLGLNRDLFPRPIHEDPLLPDAVREPLRKLLPDLSPKRLGFDEERYLFAQLLSSAPSVHVSWHAHDERGRPRAASPLLDALNEAVPTAEPPGTDPPVTVGDHLQATALAGERDVLGRQLGHGLAAKDDAAARLARFRLAALAEIDPDPTTRDGRSRRHGLGPFLGLVGPATSADDPRRRAPAITTLEQLAACPWQTFVERLLKIRAPVDPLAALPGLTPQLLGDLVHRVLERRARTAHARADGTWPALALLERWLDEEATRSLARHGLTLHGRTLRGLARAAAQRALPFVIAAQEAEPGPLPLDVQAEVERRVSVDATTPGDTAREIRLRADRCESVAGRARWTDYKTGAPPTDATAPSARREALLDGIEQGTWLQAAAYLRVPMDARLVEGRYLFLRPDLDPRHRVWALASHDPAARAAFEGVVAALLRAWDEGAFFPRLVAPDHDLEPRRCRHCAVAVACLRRDSGARRRLAAWGGTPPEEGAKITPNTDVVAAARRLWHLPARRHGDPS